MDRGQPDRARRKVYFYRAVQVPDMNAPAAAFDPAALCAALQRLDFASGEGGPYLTLRSGAMVRCWQESMGTRARLVFGNVRRDSLPDVEDSGALAPLALGPQQGLAERTHAVFFSDGIVGIESNFHGPHFSHLGRYLAAKFPHLPAFDLELLLNRQATELVNHFREIARIRVRVQRNAVPYLASPGVDDLHALEREAEYVGADVVDLALGVRPHSRDRLNLSRAREFITNAYNAVTRQQSVEAFHVFATDDRTGERRDFDLLKDYMVTAVPIVRPDARHKRIDSTAMFEAIELAYEELHDELVSAAGVQG